MALYDSYYRYTWKFGTELDDLNSLETRNSDGSGNNLTNTSWGKAHTNFQRVTENSYGDGVGTVWDLPLQNTGLQGIPPNAPFNVGTAPRPRDITNLIMAQDPSQDIPSSAGHNEYFQFFGQFLTHDMAEADVTGVEPPLFLDGLPFPFGRTPFDTYSDDHNSDPNTRQQRNEDTAFLDLSNVYGSSDAVLNLLRAAGDSARLLSGASGALPTYQEVADDKGLDVTTEVIAIIDPNGFGQATDQFACGDNRANQQTALLTHQALWMSNHNWFVDQLEQAHPDWSDEELFQAARALNEAEWQNVVYNEYVSKLIGPKALSKYSGYKADVDPSIINEWTSVAFRFGHDETSNDLGIMNEAGQQLATFTLGEAFNLNADGIRDGEGLSDWIRGQLARATQEIDGKVVDGNRNVLFGIGAIVDLEVFDIQRGRDHGVGRYNKLRDELGLDQYASFDEFAYKNKVDATTLANLKTLYGENGIDQLDSIVGGLLEKNAKGSALGETFTILNVMQWEATRDGDRFFYLNRFEDNPDLIRMVENTSLSEIIARNTDIDHIYRDAFLAHTRKGGTDGNNNINGTGSHDLLIGFGGKDKLNGKAGNDDIYGDDGDDTVTAGGGSDIVYGGKGKDNLNGEEGNDYIDGGDDADVVKGATSDDFLFGGKGRDKLYGDAGKDYLDGGYDNDHLWGGGSRDTFAFGAGSGDDIIWDFKKEDRLDLSQLEFDTLAEVRAAAYRVGKDTILDLGYGNEVKLAGVNWTLASANVALHDPYLV